MSTAIMTAGDHIAVNGGLNVALLHVRSSRKKLNVERNVLRVREQWHVALAHFASSSAESNNIPPVHGRRAPRLFQESCNRSIPHKLL
jgi:hypothetical protein